MQTTQKKTDKTVYIMVNKRKINQTINKIKDEFYKNYLKHKYNTSKLITKDNKMGIEERNKMICDLNFILSDIKESGGNKLSMYYVQELKDYLSNLE